MFNKQLNNELQPVLHKPVKIVVLVSAGRHPVSGRTRRAINDAQALELGLKLAAQYAGVLHVLHAGPVQESALRAYLGMGIAEIEVLALPPDIDVLPSLVTRLRELQPQLVLTGSRAESGWGSGCLPYFLAQALDIPIVPNADDIDLPDNAATAEVRQVLARGHRRALDVRLPALVTVDPAAPLPRQSAFARARRGRLRVDPFAIDTAAPPYFGERQPARRRPKRLHIDTTTSAAERLKAITDVAAGHGRMVEPDTAEEAAHVIYRYLIESGLLKSRS